MKTREIKFRAWDKFAKKFTVLGYAIDGNGKFVVHPEIIINQFTGVCDKNGNEIYEGDILLTYADTGTRTIAVVIFEEGAFQYQYKTKPQAPDKYRFDHHNMAAHKIIGNIYQNPELCEKI